VADAGQDPRADQSSAARVDLNADVGESFGAYVIGDDEGLMSSITSANIAAGSHAGDPSVLRQTIKLARRRQVSVGAHPGLPDLAGFGRRELRVTAREVEDLVLFQVAAVAGVAAAEGVRLRHVKPHGALYNMAARDADLAAAIVRSVKAIDPALILFGPDRSELLAVAQAAGLPTAAEGFADRGYNADGSLAPRSSPGALVQDAETVVSRALRMVRESTVVALDGTVIPLRVGTLCVHGDTPGAARLAARLRSGLEANGVAIKAITAP
jgi:UPF0271 protein